MKVKILIFSIFLSLFGAFLYINMESIKENTINQLNEHSRLTIKSTYNAVIDTYEIAAKKDFNSLMKNKKVLEILHKLKNSKELSERNVLRGELYRQLYKSYDIMKEMYVRQFHLHTDEGKSLLRMHLPYESEDSLMDFRRSIRVANTEYKSVIGFEGGRVFPGFRYVYPIVDKGQHLGSVEFSIAFEGIEAKLSSLLPMHRYQLMMSKKESYDKVFTWHRSFFSVSGVGSSYYVENPELSIITKRNLENNLVSDLASKVSAAPDFYKKLNEHKDFTMYAVEDGIAYTVDFLDMKNTDNVHAGYIVCFGEEKEIVDIINDYNIYYLVAFFLILVVFVLVLIITKQITKLRQTKNNLQHINNSLYEAQKIAHFGTVEYNHEKKKYYLSDEVYNIFGTSPEVMKPSYEALLSRVHPDDVKMVHKVYTDSIKNKSKYQVQHRIIKDNNEIIFVEEHGTHELNEDGKIVKSIGSIYDITQQAREYKNLERFIDLQNAIVILTDGNVFQFANKSFYNFFGFQDLDSFKEEHDCICELFITQEGFFSLDNVAEDKENWIESLMELSVRKRVVSMLDSTSTPHAFNVMIHKYNESVYEIEFNDISDSMMEKLQLEKQLNRDQLTKAYNRVYFETNIENLIKSNRNKNAKTGIVFLDIDHFKNINDTYGHDVGDEVLISLVALINEQIRGYDHLVRWGGEEFIIIARVESLIGIEKMTEKLRAKIQSHSFKSIPELTCSFGIAIHEDEEPIKSTVSRADEKLYEAKEAGRNRVVI